MRGSRSKEEIAQGWAMALDLVSEVEDKADQNLKEMVELFFMLQQIVREKLHADYDIRDMREKHWSVESGDLMVLDDPDDEEGLYDWEKWGTAFWRLGDLASFTGWNNGQLESVILDTSKEIRRSLCEES